MSLARVFSRAQVGLAAPRVCVEVHLGSGLPCFTIVGLPAPAVRESKERVRSALLNSGFDFPAGRVTVNLAPADLPKAGGRFDLPIALGVLRASGQLPAEAEPERSEYYGELGLAGELKSVPGLLPALLEAGRSDNRIVIPAANLAEAGLAGCRRGLAAEALAALCQPLRSRAWESAALPAGMVSGSAPSLAHGALTLAEVRGQWQAKRALAIAAAGGHSLLLIGAPGAGKTMLAQRLPALLPPLQHDEALQVAALASVSTQGFDPRAWGVRPFRAPHHTASAHAMVGGGPAARAGEISLAHLGVLFLDELPEFDRRVLEALREPLESGVISIARASRHVEYPARFLLVAAMNPCPCGYLGDGTDRCRCAPLLVQRYRSRLSGPLLDRIDLQVQVSAVAPCSLRGSEDPSSSADLPVRVARAHATQLSRQGCSNARLEVAALQRHCSAEASAIDLLERAMAKFGLSARAYHRVLRVARTIADLDGVANLQVVHVSEALVLRQAQETLPPARSAAVAARGVVQPASGATERSIGESPQNAMLPVSASTTASCTVGIAE